MTLKSDFTSEEWTLLRSAPVLAGLRVAVADHRTNVEEVAAIARAYGSAMQRLWSHPGKGGLIDAILAEGPVYDRDQFGDPPDRLNTDQIIEASTRALAEAIALLERKASPAELAAYREFVLDLAHRVAQAHQEAAVFAPRVGPISDRERAALAELESLFAHRYPTAGLPAVG